LAPKKSSLKEPLVLEKAQTGIQGLDEVTMGGLPRGRTTLVCGGPGSGKTLLGMEFLVRGAVHYDEPGVFVCFEETINELLQNAAGLGFDLNELWQSKRIFIDHILIERSEIEETGEYDLEGLFIRLDQAIKSVGAKRIVLDTIESLFSGLSNFSILRAELRRLFRWLKEKGMTAVITGEKGADGLTRHGLEEYVSDCVIVLDHRVANQITTRRMRVLKYRGGMHGTNEYPFIIGSSGIEILPITSLGLQHSVSDERISSGIPSLDVMMGGKGYYRGSTILVSGTAGTGKTSIASKFADAACRRGKRCAFFAFEESAHQILRNMQSIGMHLQPWVEKGLLKFYTQRPTEYGLEYHLITMHRIVDEFRPDAVIMDPIGNLGDVGIIPDVKAMLTRLVDYLKSKSITSFLTSLTPPGASLERTEIGISSLADTWLVLRDMEKEGERNREIYVLKSRGMAHSNQIRELLLSDRGLELLGVKVELEGVRTGSAKASQEIADSRITDKNE